MKNQFMFLISAAILFSSVSIGSAMAQNHSQNQSSLATVPENQNMATVSDSPQTVILNQTTIPAEQTTVTVNQTTKLMQN